MNRLEDMERIRDRKAKYCRFLDTKQFDPWAELFAADAQVTMLDPYGKVVFKSESIEKFVAMTKELFATAQTVHQVHVPEFSFRSEDEADVIWAMEDMHVYALVGGEPSKMMHGYGHYHETWKRANGDWRIARMELRRTVVQMR